MKCVGELYGGGNVRLVDLREYFSGGVDGRFMVYLVLPWCLFSIVRRYLMALWTMKMLA